MEQGGKESFKSSHANHFKNPGQKSVASEENLAKLVR